MQQSDAVSNQDSSREILAAAWLSHFGVDFPEELDLGTLEAIGQFVRDGCAPPPKTSP